MSPAPIRQDIRYCTARDGARIAIASIGSGPPLLRALHWLSHIEFDTESPVWRHWLRELSSGRRYIRYDQRGCGLSDWSPPAINFDAWVDDLEAVVETLGLRRFPLFGMSQGGALAVAYAVRHPERVSRLVLFGAYARGKLRRDDAEQKKEAKLECDLMRIGWGRDNPAFRQMFTTQFIPGGTREQHDWYNDLERICTTPENAARIIETSYSIEVADLAAAVRMPIIVFHAQHDVRVPFEEGKRLAALIPSARFVPLDSGNHVLKENEPAWPKFLAEMRGFLAEDAETASSPPLGGASLTPSEQEVLALLVKGLDNTAIASALGKSEKTVRNQISSIYDKLGVRTRAEAIVRIRDTDLSA